jgi:hypothetical protein
MGQRTEQVMIDGAVPVNRNTDKMPRLFALPGMWICSGHAQEPVSLLSVIGHRITSLVSGPDLALPLPYVQVTGFEKNAMRRTVPPSSAFLFDLSRVLSVPADPSES